jgi:hypothetical protein
MGSVPRPLTIEIEKNHALVVASSSPSVRARPSGTGSAPKTPYAPKVRPAAIGATSALFRLMR